MFLCVLESSGEGTHLVCVVEAAAVSRRNAAHVAHWPAGGGIPKQTGGRRKEGRREGGRMADERKGDDYEEL